MCLEAEERKRGRALPGQEDMRRMVLAFENCGEEALLEVRGGEMPLIAGYGSRGPELPFRPVSIAKEINVPELAIPSLPFALAPLLFCPPSRLLPFAPCSLLFAIRYVLFAIRYSSPLPL